MNFLCAVLGIIAFVLLAVTFTKLNLLSYVYDVKASKQGIDFYFLSINFYTLLFNNIEFVKEIKGGYQFPFSYSYKNRFFQGCLFIQKKRGVITRQILITPLDPEKFMKILTEAGVSVKK